ncbi:site-specific integrase [Sphingomonas oligophenolica]|uniref:Integrase arm-type DNA-binding domain-containing protein n=1 Tax=Sphingomonas oligophenolica TaxID=301154 RepID=A0ABU9Y234_9SPHN
MRHNVLTQMSAKALDRGKHADGQGLWLVKRDKVFGKWTLRLVVCGTRREMGLGRWPDVSIAEARDRAAVARKSLRDGSDPIADRRKAKRTIRKLTLREAIDGCFEAKKAELKRDGDAGRWMSPLNVHIIPKLGEVPIEDVDQHQLIDVLRPIWHDKSDSARKALNRLNMTLKHAAALGLNVDLQAPMKARALLGKQRHTAEHIPSLPYADAPAFYASLVRSEGIAALALRFLILTVARTSEVRCATFDEFEADIWNLPAARTKTGRDRRIPLTGEAVAIVAKARSQGNGEYLFPSMGGKPLSDAGMAAIMKRQSLTARPHGFRATFRTWVEEKTDTPFEVKESALGHVVDSDVVRAYQRSDRFERRRALMLLWEQYLVHAEIA